MRHPSYQDRDTRSLGLAKMVRDEEKAGVFTFTIPSSFEIVRVRGGVGGAGSASYTGSGGIVAYVPGLTLSGGNGAPVPADDTTDMTPCDV